MEAPHARSSGLAERRRRWTHRGESAPWFSPAIAVGATIGVFATAFVSMTSSRLTRAPGSDRPNAIPLSLAARPSIDERVRVIRRPAPRREAQRPPDAPAPTAVDTGASRSPVARDTAPSASQRPPELDPASIPRGVAMPSIGSTGGAGYVPAWVTAGTRAFGPGGSAKLRDSISDSVKAAYDLRAWTRPISGDTRAAIAQTQRQADLLERRTTSAGNWRDVHVPSGQGVGGVGGLGAVGSIGVPLFSRGPSAAQRARDAKVAAENRVIMQQLAERARAKRDSIRRDSVRADSARNAVGTRRPG